MEKDYLKQNCFFNTLLFFLLSNVMLAQSSFNSGGQQSALTQTGTISFSIGQSFDSHTNQSSVALWSGVQQPFEVNNPLPVTLIYFKAAVTSEKQVQLSWSIAMEENNDFFSIERSQNGKQFEHLKTRKSEGNRTTAYTYYEVDETPLNGVSYYRLKQTDYDGTFSYSKIVPVQLDQVNTVTMYPNPVSEQLIIRLTQQTTYNSTYEIIQMNGSVIAKGKLKDETNAIQVQHLPTGIYQLRILDAQKRVNLFKIVKN